MLCIPAALKASNPAKLCTNVLLENIMMTLPSNWHHQSGSKRRHYAREGVYSEQESPQYESQAFLKSAQPAQTVRRTDPFSIIST